MATLDAFRERRVDASALLRRAGRQRRVISLYVFLALLITATSVESETFRSGENLVNIVKQSVLLAVTSIGQLMVILTGGIDLSVGSVAKLSGLLTASIMDGQDRMVLPALAAAVGIGLVVGSANALAVTKLRVPPFIATFAAYYIVRGIAYTFSTRPTGRAAPGFYSLYETLFFGVPVVIVFLAVLWIGFAYLLKRSAFGRHIYAVGGDEQVARLAGVRTTRVKFAVYITCSVLAALAGFINLTRIGVGDPRVGEGLELDSITAVVVGGASLFGGRGSIVGTLGGVLLLGTIINMLDALQVESIYQQLIKGLIILGAFAIYRERNKK
jgi:ribose transport system permease protein